MAMYGTGSLARAVKAIIVMAITVISVFIWVSFLLVGDLTRLRSATALESERLIDQKQVSHEERGPATGSR